ncbi:MAG: SMI1/KNR4 family protein, partial [Planctomycetota bacterium]|nr:SMI1/KNR4 family protein [Planctomycetota bacterium]
REKRNYRPSPEEEFPHHCDQPLQSVYRDYMKENPADNVVPFARDPCGNLLVIGCKGVTKDWIFFYDHEMESHFALRKSFRQFLNSLRNE